MTRISFYVGQSAALQARLRLACKVLEKAQMQALNTYIHVDSPATCQQLDELIWTYNDLSFIPHTIAPQKEDGVRVQLGYDHEPMEDCDFLINLSNETPEFFPRFARMAEILDQETDILRAGRQRYLFYRDRGYNLDYHQL
ncbi:MAG: DNA polymerase III subunit chi [Thiolinea sp.]